MIFVILGGVVEYDFSRILKILDELVPELGLKKENVIAQIGHTKYEPVNYEWFRFVDGEKFNKYIDEATVIITHGGVGSILKSMNLHKKIIVFPRLYEFNEHIDNHQIEICEKLFEGGYVLYADNKEKLKKSIVAINSFIPQIWKNDNKLMESIIYDYLNQLKGD